MSRSKKGTKPPGWEVWSKRPAYHEKAKESVELKKIVKEELGESVVRTKTHLIFNAGFMGYRVFCSAESYEDFEEVPGEWTTHKDKVTCKKCLKKLGEK